MPAIEEIEPVTMEMMKRAWKVVEACPDVVETPLLCNAASLFPSLDQDIDLYMKLENMQTAGSFKIRGIMNQMEHLPRDVLSGLRQPVTMSAGNYGKAFAYCLHKQGLKGLVYMPHTAPEDRVAIIKGYGMDVQKVPSGEVQQYVDQSVAEGYIQLHAFDDANLIAGYSSISKEILATVPDPDVVVVCCGGGGLVAGIAAGIKMSGHQNCRVYAVEPMGAATLHKSFQIGEAATISTARSVATGLMPPFTGKLPYKLCRRYVEDVLLVDDWEMVDTMKLLYNRGMVVEPAGTAALTALLTGRIPDVKGKKVVIIISGGNVSPTDLAKLIC